MVEIRFYNAATECPALAELMVECDLFHRAPKPDKSRFEAYLSSLPPGVEILVAVDHDRLVGFVSFSTLYASTDALPQFFMKEIFISARIAKERSVKILCMN